MTEIKRTWICRICGKVTHNHYPLCSQECRDRFEMAGTIQAGPIRDAPCKMCPYMKASGGWPGRKERALCEYRASHQMDAHCVADTYIARMDKPRLCAGLRMVGRNSAALTLEELDEMAASHEPGNMKKYSELAFKEFGIIDD